MNIIIIIKIDVIIKFVITKACALVKVSWLCT